MSRSSSKTSQASPGRSSMYYDHPYERCRSLSVQPVNQYYSDFCNTPNASYEFDHYSFTDVPRLLELYEELLGDNLRLWECVNAVRCGRHVPVKEVIRKLFSISDEEFYRKYPAYASFRMSGHGALHSEEEGGGSHDNKKYVHHLREHNSGLWRENARLKHCLQLLSDCPERSADEVVSHCFSLDDEGFIRRYPEAGRLVNFAFRQSGGSNGSGPSCSNNNDLGLHKTSAHGYKPRYAEVHPVYGEDDRQSGDEMRARSRGKECPLDDLYVRGGSPRAHYPGAQFARRRLIETSKSHRSRAKTKEENEGTTYGQDHSTGKTRVPYMVSLHPYNWATSNNSSAYNRPGYSRGDDPYESEFQPEDDEESGIVYRKYRSSAPLGKYLPSRPVRGRSSDSLLAQKTRGPKISFSRSPAKTFRTSLVKQRGCLEPSDEDAFFSKSSSMTHGFSLAKERQRCDVSDEDAFFEHDRHRAVMHTARNRSKLPVLRRDNGDRKGSLTELRNATEKKIGHYTPPRRESPRKQRSCQQMMSPPMSTQFQVTKPMPESRQSGRNVTIKQNNDYFSQLNRQRAGSGNRSHSPFKKSRPLHMNDLMEKPRPMYYKHPRKKTFESESEEEIVEDEDVYLPRRQPGTYSPMESQRRRRERFPTMEKWPPSNFSGRLARSVSEDTLLHSEGFSRDLDQSRLELLQLRYSYQNSFDNYSAHVRPTDTRYPDHREAGSAEQSNLTQPFRVKPSNSPNKKRYPELVISKGGQIKEKKKHDSTIFTNLSQRTSDPRILVADKAINTGQTSPPRKSAIPLVKLPKQPVPLAANKPHRTPTRRHLFASVDRQNMKKGTKTACALFCKGVPLHRTKYENENANRYPGTSSRLEGSDHTIQDGGLDYCSHSGLPTEENEDNQDLIDQLLHEKRELDEKYEDKLAPKEKYRDNLCLDREYRDKLSLDEKYRNKLHPDVKHESTSLVDEMCLGSSLSDQDKISKRRSWSEPSLRTFGWPETDTSMYSTSSDPSWQTNSFDDSYKSDRKYFLSNRKGGVSSNESKDKEESYCEAIEQLREETKKLKDETDKCRLERMRRKKEMENLFLSAYDNLGFPVQQKSKANQHQKQDKNTNSNSPTVKLVWKPSPIVGTKEKNDSVSSVFYSPETTSSLNKLVQHAETSWESTFEVPKTILGELAFQLEGRIIRQVFKGVPPSTEKTKTDGGALGDRWSDDTDKRYRFYGFTVLNLPQKIRWDCRDPITGKRDASREAKLLRRYQDIVGSLRKNFGYHVHKHGKMTQRLIQKHGVFIRNPDVATIMRLGLHDFRSVRNHVIRLSEREVGQDMLVLVDCLKTLADKESEPILSFR